MRETMIVGAIMAMLVLGVMCIGQAVTEWWAVPPMVVRVVEAGVLGGSFTGFLRLIDQD